MRLWNTFFALAALSVLVSCTNGSSGIFAGLEVEQKVTSTGGLSTTASVTHIAESRPLSGYYITGGQSLFLKGYSASVWGRTTIPANTSATIYAVGTTGVTTSGDGETDSAYGTNVWVVAGGVLYMTTTGTTWTAQTLSGGETPIDLIPVRMGSDGYSTTELIVVTQVAMNSLYNTNHFYFINDSATAPTIYGPFVLQTSSDTTGANGLTYPILSAVNTGATTSSTTTAPYYFMSANYIWAWGGPTTAWGTETTNSTVTAYATTAATASASSSATTITAAVHPVAVSVGTPSTDFGGIFYYGGYLYLGTTRHAGTTTGGGIYSAGSSALSTSSISFSTIKTNAENSSGYPISFGQWIYNDTNGDFWIATGASTTYEGTGYVEFSQDGSGGGSLATTPNTNSSNYTSSLLYEYAVGSLFRAYNGGSGLYYLGTLAHGLWYWNESGNSTNPWTQD